MSILIGRETKVVVQGITGRDGSFHTKGMIEYGTSVVAGVTPGRGGEKVEKVPVFDAVETAVKETGANTSIIFVPAPAAPDAVYEAVDAGVKLVVCITEGVPTLEMAPILPYVTARGARLVGPNCPGLISPGRAKVGIMPGAIHREGNVGVVSRSGTLTYEMVHQLSELGIGQTTCIGVGGDPIVGTRFLDVLRLFGEDAETVAVVLIGEIGGSDEEEAAAFIRDSFDKPVVAFIAGQSAPPGKRMGHAGAIVSGGTGTAADKIEALSAAGVGVARTPSELGRKVAGVLGKG